MYVPFDPAALVVGINPSIETSVPREKYHDIHYYIVFNIKMQYEHKNLACNQTNYAEMLYSP